MPALLWTLPWHYLATSICLLYRSDRHSELMDRLKGDAVDLSEVLDPDQPRRGNGNPPLFDEVQMIGACATSKPFDWSLPWDPNLALRLRSWDKEKHGDFILTHDALYLRYPFPEAILDAPNPIPLEDGVPGATDFYAVAFMEAIDELVTTKAGREFFSKDGTVDGPPPNDTAALSKIVGWIFTHYSSGALPQGIPSASALQVHVEEGLPTYQTGWERYDDHFLLHLGWLEPEGRHLEDELNSIIYDWPCGAL